MRTHLVIPDTQVRPGVPLDHLSALGEYIVRKQPDVIISLGDFGDMHSLSSYDQGRKAGEGARYMEDIEVVTEAMELLTSPIKQYNKSRKKGKRSQYKPEMHLTLGNHENRINRHVNTYPVLSGLLSTDNLGYQNFGWKVHNFLEVVTIDGIQYSHFFPRNSNGRIMQTVRGAPTASLQVRREMRSSTAGHLQGLDYALYQTSSQIYHGLIAGSFYMHEEDYLSPQGTRYWRGVILKHEVRDGHYDPMFVSLDYLLRRFT